jgi:endonuclease I
MWTYYHTTDVKDNGTVWDMYSNNVWYFSSNPNGSTSGMEREHSFPKSWWAVSDQVDNYAAYSDLNHLYPADGPANRAKSNYILGEVTNPSFNNGVSKVGKNAYNFAGAPAATAFEPADEYKGDFARTYLYMITCYEDYAQQWRSDALNMLNNETYPVLKPWAKDMLLKWHRNDPVSNKELVRNEEVYGYQNNRNPFIDFPQLVEYIWGDSVNYVFKLPGKVEPTLITPVNLSEIYVGETRINVEIEKTITLKGSGLSGNLSISVYGTNANFFHITETSVPAAAVNSENGYQLKITYKSTEYGEHQASLAIFDGGMEGSALVYLKAICSKNTAVIPVESNYPDLYVEGKTVFFRAYDPNSQVEIFNSSGNLIHRDVCTGFWQYYLCSQPGVYILSVNNKARKLITQ